MDTFVLRVLLACVLYLVPLASFAQADDVERLRIHGSHTIGARLMPALVESWLDSMGYEGIRRLRRDTATLEIHAQRDGTPLVVEITGKGSASGITALVDGQAELAMMTRAPSAEEMDAAWQLGDLRSSGQEFVIAVDGIAAIVHASNPLRQLSARQLRDVFSGRITNWRQLGGPDRPIRASLHPMRTASSEFFRDAVMGDVPLASWVRTDRQVAAAVAADPAAIGIIPLRSRVPRDVRPLAISRGGLAVYPTRVDIHSEDYPLLRRYSLHGGQMMSALGRSFALFSVTRRAQETVARAGHFSLMLRPVRSAVPVDANDAYRRVIAGAERLPLSLRFNHVATGSLFDTRAEHDLERLVALMRLPRFRNRQLVVVAFGHRDGNGDLIPRLISNDRADIIVGYLHDHGMRVRRALGLGTDRMLEAPGSPNARFRNERVEIWML